MDKNFYPFSSQGARTPHAGLRRQRTVGTICSAGSYSVYWAHGMTANGTRKSRTAHEKIIILMYIISFAVIVYFLIDGLSYYTTPYDQRPRNEDYGLLKPSGTRGHALGIIGSAMMIFMLLYSIRKRTRLFGTFGKLRHWLNFHIYFGVVGPILVVIHTSFKVQGLVKVSFWSMVAVALSGVFGRYLYLQIPRDVQGESLSLQELQTMKDRMTAQLQDDVKLSGKELTDIENALSSGIRDSRGILFSIWAVLLDDLRRPFRIRRARRRYLSKLKLPRKVQDEIVELVLRKTLLERRILVLNRIQQLFHYWHVFHKPFAIIMYIIMIVHVAVAVWLGYVWVF